MAKRYGGISEDSLTKGSGIHALLSGGTSGFNAVLGGNRSEGQDARLEAHGLYRTSSERDPGTAPFYNSARADKPSIVSPRARRRWRLRCDVSGTQDRLGRILTAEKNRTGSANARRRGVTGHNADGKATAASDTAVDAITLKLLPGAESSDCGAPTRRRRFQTTARLDRCRPTFHPLEGSDLASSLSDQARSPCRRISTSCSPSRRSKRSCPAWRPTSNPTIPVCTRPIPSTSST